ncbi:uncharacterized protein PAN0_007c3273 [Moesziomyces antarcticus]|uniref:Uncharacterized protein n=1 Tax=Pseudozyma antarctica TaxID=84753 RepID=A0A081CEG0_PSEA2|nr:uncharacterized protein PAN0_007c3273 [Moesziomyces antarcticus]GAK65056.1 hypothetical protein PAN0_007c3273 [Moesziomyces antarcticus]
MGYGRKGARAGRIGRWSTVVPWGLAHNVVRGGSDKKAALKVDVVARVNLRLGVDSGERGLRSAVPTLPSGLAFELGRVALLGSLISLISRRSQHIPNSKRLSPSSLGRKQTQARVQDYLKESSQQGLLHSWDFIVQQTAALEGTLVEQGENKTALAASADGKDTLRASARKPNDASTAPLENAWQLLRP